MFKFIGYRNVCYEIYVVVILGLGCLSGGLV